MASLMRRVKGPESQRSKGPKVQRSKGPEEQPLRFCLSAFHFGPLALWPFGPFFIPNQKSILRVTPLLFRILTDATDEFIERNLADWERQEFP